MGRTRFMVVKAKELIKTAVFAVLGVIILVGLIAFFLGSMTAHIGTVPITRKCSLAKKRRRLR